MSFISVFLRLRKNEKKTAKDMKAYQRKRLNKLLHYAWNHSEYYREAFENAGIKEVDIDTCDITRLPVMDKDILMGNFDKVITTKDVTQKLLLDFNISHDMSEKKLPGGYHIVHSSGSTGEPRFFLYDKKAWNEMLAGIVRGALWGMTIPEIIKLLTGGIRILYIAAVDGRYGGVMAVGDGVHGLGGKFRTLDINTPLADWPGVIREYNPNVVIGYSSAMKILAGVLEENKIHCNFKRIITCGEPLSESLRAYLEEVFDRKIINFYGASESLALGVEVDPKEGMILFDDMNLVECENDELLITSLYNYAQPIIRYKIHDRMELNVAMGNLPFSTAKGQIFRDEDILWFKNEAGKDEFIHPLAIEGFQVDGLLDYQFIKIDSSKFKMHAQVSDTSIQERITVIMKDLMGKILQEKDLSNVVFDVDFVDVIHPDNATGKKRLVLIPAEEGC